MPDDRAPTHATGNSPAQPQASTATPVDIWRAVAAETIGTALLLWAIVGSGIAVTHDGPPIAMLFPHAVVVGLALAAIIVMFGPISGAHLNPAVTLAAVLLGHLPRSRAAAYVTAQLVGGALGTIAANATFGLAAVTVARRTRDGAALAVSELVATLVLVLLIFLMVRAGHGPGNIGAAVGAYIAAALIFTPSTSFANPAVTVARTLSDTFTGIAPASVPWFVIAQLVGALAAVVLVQWFGAGTPGARR
jgi:glycerol uptake facilitator-like aquaporin